MNFADFNFERYVQLNMLYKKKRSLSLMNKTSIKLNKIDCSLGPQRIQQKPHEKERKKLKLLNLNSNSFLKNAQKIEYLQTNPLEKLVQKNSQSNTTTSSNKNELFSTPQQTQKTVQKFSSAKCLFLAQSATISQKPKAKTIHLLPRETKKTKLKMKKMFLSKEVPSLLTSITATCKNLEEGIKQEQEKLDFNFDGNDEIQEDIKSFVKETPPTVIAYQNERIINEVRCASKIDARFAYKANKTLNEMFNKKSTSKKESIVKNQKLASLKLRQSYLKKKTEKILTSSSLAMQRMYKSASSIDLKN